MLVVNNIFDKLHQLLVLIQINITQFVLVRLPDRLGLFKPDMANDLKHQMRDKLLTTAINYEGEGGTDALYNDAQNSKNPLAAVLSKLKEAQAKDDDHFRA